MLQPGAGFDGVSAWEKVCFTSLNAAPSPPFLPILEKRVNYLPQVSKPFTLPPCPYYKWFSKVVLSFKLKINLINIFKPHKLSLSF
jgi:hypothetical protein